MKQNFSLKKLIQLIASNKRSLLQKLMTLVFLSSFIQVHAQINPESDNEQENTIDEAAPLKIGDELYGGCGTIFYLDRTGQHGLVCVEGSGPSNWDDARAECQTIMTCHEMGWRLPSKKEMNLMAENLYNVGQMGNGSYEVYYWTSTGGNNDGTAWVVSDNEGEDVYDMEKEHFFYAILEF
jgi:hypothetical protein